MTDTKVQLDTGITELKKMSDRLQFINQFPGVIQKLVFPSEKENLEKEIRVKRRDIITPISSHDSPPKSS
jgi:hypothetical protein